MWAPELTTAQEHLTPHDLVEYFRCPREMVLSRSIRRGATSSVPVDPAGELRPEPRSPLFAPPLVGCRTVDGSPDFLPGDTMIYIDSGERDLPMVFPPESIRPDPRLSSHGSNLIDVEWEISGRPDFVVQDAGGNPYPIEYKATHLFGNFHDHHGRLFDVIQAIAECRLVHAALGVRPSRGVVWYGDTLGEGRREGWMEISYGPAQERWLAAALHQVRSDRERRPVPTAHHCAPCVANRAHLCRVAAVPPGASSS